MSRLKYFIIFAILVRKCKILEYIRMCCATIRTSRCTKLTNKSKNTRTHLLDVPYYNCPSLISHDLTLGVSFLSTVYRGKSERNEASVYTHLYIHFSSLEIVSCKNFFSKQTFLLSLSSNAFVRKLIICVLEIYSMLFLYQLSKIF